MLAAARRVKPDGLFLNESLTPQRQSISFALRNAKRQHPDIVSGCKIKKMSRYELLSSNDTISYLEIVKGCIRERVMGIQNNENMALQFCADCSLAYFTLK